MEVKIYDTWHDTEEIVEVDSLEQAIKENEEFLKDRAYEIAESEVEEDWEEYYETYEKALEATRYSIFTQFQEEQEYTILENQGAN